MSHLIKTIIVGDSSVGKSSILTQFADNEFASLGSTIGIDFKIKEIRVRDKYIKFQIWDTSGQERFRSIRSSYYRGASIIILVFSVSDPDTFNSLPSWIREIDNFSNPNSVRVLVGNKKDQRKSCTVAVDNSDISSFAQQYNMVYYEVSAKTGENIAKLFQELGQVMYDNIYPFITPPLSHDRVILGQKIQTNDNSNGISKCC